jgi:hypothetical protein
MRAAWVLSFVAARACNVKLRERTGHEDGGPG